MATFQNHCTTFELKLVTGCSYAAINTVIGKPLAGLPDNPHPVKRGRPRVVSRSEAGSIVVGVQLYEAGQTTDAIRSVVMHPDFARILAGDARLLVLEASGTLSAFDEIDDDLRRAMEVQNSMPMTMVDLRSVRERVEAAIDYCEVHRWGFDRSKLGQIAKSQAEIKQARDAFIAIQKATV